MRHPNRNTPKMVTNTNLLSNFSFLRADKTQKVYLSKTQVHILGKKKTQHISVSNETTFLVISNRIQWTDFKQNRDLTGKISGGLQNFWAKESGLEKKRGKRGKPEAKMRAQTDLVSMAAISTHLISRGHQHHTEQQPATLLLGLPLETDVTVTVATTHHLHGSSTISTSLIFFFYDFILETERVTSMCTSGGRGRRE